MVRYSDARKHIDVPDLIGMRAAFREQWSARRAFVAHL